MSPILKAAGWGGLTGVLMAVVFLGLHEMMVGYSNDYQMLVRYDRRKSIVSKLVFFVPLFMVIFVLWTLNRGQ